MKRIMVTVACAAVLLASITLAGTNGVALIHLDSRDYNGSPNLVMKAMELERNAKTSKIKVVYEKGGSVGSSMFVAMAFCEIAKARGFRYFVNLKEWDGEDGSWMCTCGFTNKKRADIKKEFGSEFSDLDDAGKKREVMSVAVCANVLTWRKKIVEPRADQPTRAPGARQRSGARDDGALHEGVALPNPWFTDNGDGTVKAYLTGLIWLKNANGFGVRAWATAMTDCATLNSGELGLSDGSTEGDWRLPTVKELQSLIDFGRSSPALPSGHPFTGVQLDAYWSSSTGSAGLADFAWRVYLHNGDAGYNGKTGTHYVWPVRGGK